MHSDRSHLKKISLIPSRQDNDYLEIENSFILPARLNSGGSESCFVKLLAITSGCQTVMYYPVKFSEKLKPTEFIISRSLRYKLGFLSDHPITMDLIPATELKNTPAARVKFLLQKTIPYQSQQVIELNHHELIALIRNRCRSQCLTLGQLLYFPYDKNTTIELRVEGINDLDYSAIVDHRLVDDQAYSLSDDTRLTVSVISFMRRHVLLKSAPDSEVKEVAPVLPASIPSIQPAEINAEPDPRPAGGLPPTFTIDFKSKGIGGHHQELERLVREAFFTRALGREGAESYGIRHTKGILLYGPPGTGKTLIAREIAKMFSHKKVKVVNGPELKNRYVGQSAENLRSIFADAWWDWNLYGERSDLHVIIFDEIDAICPKRGSRTAGTGVDDDMVAQFLTILDGVDSPQNFVVIGMTNRKDIIDEALLRSGRLEVHIEIKLPDEQGRLEILEIKTQKMREHQLLDDSVDLSHWASVTHNYSGAELESLVVKATQFAIHGNLDFSEKKLALRDMSQDGMQKVSHDHFKRAFATIQPAFGSAQLSQQKRLFIPYHQAMRDLAQQFIRYYQNEKITFGAFCFAGEGGVGKTAFARHLADSAGATCVRYITPDRLLGLTLPQQIALFDEELFQVTQVDNSVLILDDLEGLLQSDVDGVVYNNSLRIKIEYFLRALSELQNHCYVIVTVNRLEFIDRLNLTSLFNVKQSLAPILWERLSSREIIELIVNLAGSLGYRFVETDDAVELPMSGKMTMRELIAHLNHFASQSRQDNQLSFDQFISLIRLESSSVHLEPSMTQDESLCQTNQSVSAPLFFRRST